MIGTHILFTTLGGVALLLWGVRMVRTGVMRAFGAVLMSLMGAWVGNRFRAAAIGAVVGTILQSSTATALLVSPLVAQGAVVASGALAVMLGADLGSAIAALIFSSGISVTWPVLTFVGYVIHVSFGARNARMKNIGRIGIGLGLLFLGLRTISASAAEISSSTVVIDVVEAATNEPVIMLLLGVMLTWVSYSSVAVVLLAVALAGTPLFTADQMLPLILGVNLGAALPALTSTLSEAPATRRIPFGNMVFRVVGVAIALALLGPIERAIAALTVSDATGVILLHLCFNAALIPLFIGFVDPVAGWLGRWLPDHAIRGDRDGPRYLDEALLVSPPAALAAAERETLRMGETIEEMLMKTFESFEEKRTDVSNEVEASEDRLDALNEGIKIYLTRLMGEELGAGDTQRAVEIVTYTTNLEHVGDIIVRNLLELAAKKKRTKVRFSEQGFREIREIHARIMDTLNLSLNVFMTGHVQSARLLIHRKTEMRGMEIEGVEKHIDRLREGWFESVMSTSIHLDVLRDFKRINSHLASVAYPVLERAGELRRSRLTAAADSEQHHRGPETNGAA